MTSTNNPEPSPRIECDVLFGVCVMAWSRGQLVFKMHSSESAIRRLGRCKDKHRMEAEERLRSAKQPFDSIRVRFYSSPNAQGEARPHEQPKDKDYE